LRRESTDAGGAASLSNVAKLHLIAKATGGIGPRYFDYGAARLSKVDITHQYV